MPPRRDARGALYGGSCRFAFEGGTRALNDLNEIAETEVPTQAVQSRLAQTFWAFKMELVDRSIDRGIFEGDASFTQENSRTALPFFNRDSCRESLTWSAENRTICPESQIELPIDRRIPQHSIQNRRFKPPVILQESTCPADKGLS